MRRNAWMWVIILRVAGACDEGGTIVPDAPGEAEATDDGGMPDVPADDAAPPPDEGVGDVPADTPPVPCSTPLAGRVRVTGAAFAVAVRRRAC